MHILLGKKCTLEEKWFNVIQGRAAALGVRVHFCICILLPELTLVKMLKGIL